MITLKLQERFGSTPPLYDESSTLIPGELWTIPLSFATTGMPDFSPANQRPRLFLDKASTFAIVPITTQDTDWIVTNVDASGNIEICPQTHSQLSNLHTFFSLFPSTLR